MRSFGSGVMGIALALTLCGTALAEESKSFFCEVLEIEGVVMAAAKDGSSREIKKGDLLAEGEILRVGNDSFADVAYDKEWKNIVRFEENSRGAVASVAPPAVSVTQGTVFAKLKSIPRNSSFEVRTPTAVATARGTEYRAQFMDGRTDILNDSPSKVYVYGLSADGDPMEDTLQVLEQDTKSIVAEAGSKPTAPAPMTTDESKEGHRLSEHIQKGVDTAVSEGRVSSIQSVADIETVIEEHAKRAAAKLAANDSELSRVTDTRRRAFAGNSAMAPPDEPASETEDTGDAAR